jgi:membrane-bound serine protease (ClpP class)
MLSVPYQRLALLGDPNVALVTLLIGILLIYLECNRPGIVLPGCLGALLVLLSVHTLRQVPLRPAALAFATAGTGLILLELAVRARNLLAATGILTLAFALATLPQPFTKQRVHLSIAIVVALGYGVPTLWLARIALRARRNKRTPASDGSTG